MYRQRASRFLSKRDTVKTFDARSDMAPAAPMEHELAWVLITVILNGKNRLYGGTIKGLMRGGWKDVFSGKWGLKKVRGGVQNWNEGTFGGLLKENNNPPDEDWDGYHLGLAKLALKACGCDQDRARDLLTELGGPVKRLGDSLTLAFDFAEGRRTPLESDVDSVLRSQPFWKKEDWTGPRDPEPSKKVPDIIKALRGEKRIVYVRGDAFCAKREVLKGVIDTLENGEPLRLRDGTPMRIFGRALGGISPSLFVDDVFDYFNPPGSIDRQVRGHLDTEGKIAVIRAAAARTPTLFIVSDMEPFDKDSVVRRLTNHRIADILAAIVEDGHPETRVLIGVRSSTDVLPWPDAYGKPFALEPSREEFDEAVKGLRGELKARVQNTKTLSGQTMRLAMPIIKLAKEKGGLNFADQFVRALGDDNARNMFGLIWNNHLKERDGDRFLHGLIACSQDGLRIVTLNNLMDALRKMPSLARHAEILAVTPDLRDWQAQHDDLVRWRKVGKTGEPDEEDVLYVREQFRPLILERWKSQFSDLARAALWCIAREAFDQARTGLVKDGIDGFELAFSRKLQAVNALVASVDTAEIEKQKAFGHKSPSVRIARSLLPPLSLEGAPMPAPSDAYRYAWTQLYCRDIGARSQRLSLQSDDPLARLDALLPFVQPERFFQDNPVRRLCRGEGKEVSEHDLGVAAKALTPVEQVELLTAIALSALSSGSQDAPHLVRDAARLARDVQENHCHKVSDRNMMRVLRAEVDLGLLCGGNPDWKFNFGHPRLDDESKPYKLEGVAWRIGQIIEDIQSRIPVDGKGRKRFSDDDRWVLGKWYGRLGEVLQLQNEPAWADRAFHWAFYHELQLSRSSAAGSATPTIMGGRIARRMVRHILHVLTNAEFARVDFPSDELIWPAPSLKTDAISKDERRDLDLVHTLLDINRTRVSRGSWPDRLGVVLDDVRLAMAERNFSKAQENIALTANSTRGAGYEVLLELAMLRASLEIEHAMRLRDVWSPEPSETRLADLKRHRASLEDMLQSFETLIGNMLPAGDQLEPYYGYLLFLRGQAEIVQSRIDKPRSPERRKSLQAAAENFRKAIEKMETTGYLCHLERIKQTLDCVNAVLRRAAKLETA